MREVTQGVTNDDLIAYADGRLPPDRLRVVEAHLRTNPEAAQFVEVMGQQNEELRAAFDPVLREAVPERLVAATRRRSLARPAMTAAAALLIGLIGGWGMHDYSSWQDGATIAAFELGDRAVLAHTIYAARDEPPLDLRSDEPTIVAQWIREETGVQMRAPRLADLGYELLGGRLMMGNEQPASLLVYAGQDGKRVSLFIENDLSNDIEPGFSREGELGVVRWAKAGRGYGLAGPLEQNDLDALASAVRLQMRVAMLNSAKEHYRV